MNEHDMLCTQYDVASSSGFYFPALKADPGRYVKDRVADGTVAMLEGLRARGHKLFIVTNSNHDYAELLLKQAFRCERQWRALFDLVVFRAKKKKGFFKNTSSPFSTYCGESKKVGRNEVFLVEPPSTRTPHTEFLEGSAAGLARLFGKEEGGSSLSKVCYFGDCLHGDVVLAKEAAGWGGVSVVEEWERRGCNDEGNFFEAALLQKSDACITDIRRLPHGLFSFPDLPPPPSSPLPPPQQQRWGSTKNGAGGAPVGGRASGRGPLLRRALLLTGAGLVALGARRNKGLLELL